MSKLEPDYCYKSITEDGEPCVCFPRWLPQNPKVSGHSLVTFLCLLTFDLDRPVHLGELSKAVNCSPKTAIKSINHLIKLNMIEKITRPGRSHMYKQRPISQWLIKPVNH